MPKLRVQHHDGHTDEVPLDGQPVVIGRDAACDLTIDSAYVSRRHARIDATSLGYVALDAGSSNGTLVNGTLIEGATILADGDRIDIGGAILTFVSDDHGDNERTMPLARALPITVDPGTRRLWVHGTRVDAELSVQEFQLLNSLCTRYGRVVGRDDIATEIWGAGNYDYGMLHTLMRRTKNKLGPPLRDAIVAIPRVGYKIELP